MSLEVFSPAVRTWFETTFAAPTPAQSQAWPAIARGDHALVLAPTGSGKTLAAFLWALNRLMAEPPPEDEARRTRVLYISPLRALAVDVEKNLQSPLRGIELAGERLGEPVQPLRVAIRSGDTPADERRKLVRHPPDVLITTPESLYLMLTSQARETLRSVEHVIIDEIHAMAGTKRGAHLSLSLERLEEITDVSPQRIGLSATQRPLDEIARFLGGFDGKAPRPVTIVDAGISKELEIEVVVPVDDMGALGESTEPSDAGPFAEGPARRSIWPSMHPRLLELIKEHRSTLIFVNSRRLAERLATRLNELEAEHLERERLATLPPAERAEALEQDDGFLAPVDLVRAHHGSLSRVKRLEVEDRLKRGELAGLVCTSSLELGIDMGAVDLVIQVESPRSVASGLQRIGRAGHQVGEPSRGKVFPKHRSDLVEATVVSRQMQRGGIEETTYPRNPLDVLAQQIVAMSALDDWPVERLQEIVRRSANFSDLSDEVFQNVLDLLSGRYPSEEFSELRPRIVWDRVENVIRGRAGTQRLAVTSGGTIPDRGLFGVFLPDGTRVGELDEEMVYESRPGETFLLGASTWRIEEITFERVVVTPAPGQPGRMPFWHGDGPGRPYELGVAVGEFLRTIRGSDAHDRLMAEYSLDALAADNVLSYLDDQVEAAGVVPDDRTIVVERFPDEIGDWRVCILSPFGAQVHAPWAMALRGSLAEELGRDLEIMWSDDGIVMRLPEAIDDIALERLLPNPEDIDQLVIDELPSTAMFSARFRECAARSLLLPRRRPDQRTPLWQQRQRSADLLGVASGYADFPILLETTRECLNDVFDVPALRRLLQQVQQRSVRVVPVDTQRASPFAQSLLFGWIAVYVYEGDAPLAERRATALALDRDLLRDLLGAEELRELIDPGVLADLELELQRLVDGRRARNADDLHDLLRTLGPLSELDISARVEGDHHLDWLAELEQQRRVVQATLAGRRQWAASEDASRLRDVVGVALPNGLPAVFTEPVERPLHDLLRRFARTHGPFLDRTAAAWLGVAVEPVHQALRDLQNEGLVAHGEFRPGGVEREWCDEDVLRRLRRRSLAALRHEIEPVDPAAMARFLPEWHGVGRERRGADGVAEILTGLEGAPLVASTLESDVLPARMLEYRPSMLDELCTSGEVVWTGSGALGSRDGRIRLVFRDHVSLLALAAEDSVDPGSQSDLHRALLDHLGQAGASFWPDLVGATVAAGLEGDDAPVLAALWDLVWAGLVTNDSLAPLRAFTAKRRRTGEARRRRPRPGQLRRVGPPSGAGRWSLVESLVRDQADPTAAAFARARQLLERHGIVTREAVLAEGQPGGFAGIYPVLKAMEEQGKVRRGYFVAGLGAAQFALPGAVDRLRDQREPTSTGPEALVLAATDPAQPYGAALAWPASSGRPARAAGAYVLLLDGEPAVYVERGGRSLASFAVESDVWAGALADAVRAGRLGTLEVAKVDGADIGEFAGAVHLTDAGFTRGYKGFVLRPTRSRR